MAATGVKVHIDVSVVRAKIKRLVQQVKDTQGMWDSIGETVVRSVHKNFREGGRPQWAALSPAYAATKAEGDIVLTGTGALKDSINHQADNEGVDVGTATPYAAIHQFGGKTKPHTIQARFAKALRFVQGNQVVFRKSVQHPGSKVPKRPFLTLQAEDYDTIVAIIEEHITEGW